MHPVLLQTPWVTLYTYGLLVASGALLAFVLTLRMAPSAGISKAEAADLVLLLFVSGIVGARSFYVGQHPEQYVGRFWHAWSLQEGGLVWYGGFILAVIAGVLYAAVKRLSVMKLCDLFSPVAALAHALGRLGCFFNGCCYGREASLPWGVSFGPGAPPRLPTQLYEAVFLWALGIHLMLI